MKYDYLPKFWWLNPWSHVRRLAMTAEGEAKMHNMAKIHVAELQKRVDDYWKTIEFMNSACLKLETEIEQLKAKFRKKKGAKR